MQLEEADYGMTDQAMARPGAAPGDENLLVRFYPLPIQNNAKTEEEGRPIFEEKDMVEIRIPGQTNPIVNRVATKADIARFPEHFRRYKARESQEVVSGTPLSEWPGVTRSQVEEFRFMSVTTVEQLINMSDLQSQRFMGINALKAKAKAYLEAAKLQGEANALAEAKRKLDEQQALNATLSSRLEALESLLSKNTDEPKRRGRPPKESSERTT